MDKAQQLSWQWQDVSVCVLHSTVVVIVTQVNMAEMHAGGELPDQEVHASCVAVLVTKLRGYIVI
jgi:hypothetical protein